MKKFSVFDCRSPTCLLVTGGDTESFSNLLVVVSVRLSSPDRQVDVDFLLVSPPPPATVVDEDVEAEPAERESRIVCYLLRLR